MRGTLAERFNGKWKDLTAKFFCNQRCSPRREALGC